MELVISHPSSKFLAVNASAKNTLFHEILPALGQKSPYFPLEAIREAVNARGLALTPGSLKVYVSAAVRQGIVHDGGRDWYSPLGECVAIDPRPVASLIRAVKKAFPLLEFSVWSTAQINPWMHHVLISPVAFLYADGEALESVGEKLRDGKWLVTVDPTPTQGSKIVRPGPRTVVIRPSISKQPDGGEHLAPVEKILVDLLAETPKLALMDDSEARGVVGTVLSRYLVSFAAIKSYAARRGVVLPAIDTIAQSGTVTDAEAR